MVMTSQPSICCRVSKLVLGQGQSGSTVYNGMVLNFQYVVYEVDSDWLLNGYTNNDPGTATVAQDIMSLIAGGIAAIDVNARASM